MKNPYYAGSNFETIVGNDHSIVMKTRNHTGEGIITIYEIMKGIEIVYSDFHMREMKSEFVANKDIFCVDHCREGRIEQEVKPNMMSYISAGDLRIDNRSQHNKNFYFPLEHYHGITISFDMDIADTSIHEIFQDFPVHIKDLRKKFCTDSGRFIVRNEYSIEHIFSELYTVPQNVRKHYLIIKTLELLLYLDTLTLHTDVEERPYFYKVQTEKIKAIHALITEDYNQHYTLDELAKRFDITLTVMKNCFKSIYGKPIYSYLLTYRMNKAANLLLTTTWDVARIAGEVGYDSPGKFSKAFKKEMYMSPIEYRNERKRKSLTDEN